MLASRRRPHFDAAAFFMIILGGGWRKPVETIVDDDRSTQTF